MDHEIEGLPPFSPDGEMPDNDLEFLEECDKQLGVILNDNSEIRLLNNRLSRNDKFGLVYRVDFKTEFDDNNSVNRLMFWKLPDGEIANFAGMDIPAGPL